LIQHWRGQFGVHDGVTVLTGPGGRAIVPSLRKYDGPVDLSTVARLFRAQRERDATDRNLRRYSTGHYGPIVGRDLQCDGLPAEMFVEKRKFGSRRYFRFSENSVRE
jgi:hypothetical protein